MDGGRVLVAALKRAGVRDIFTLHGVHIDPVFQACLDMGIRMIDSRHEAAAGHAAEGYARATRRPGVVVVTAGPGFTNVLTSITNARLDDLPVLYIAGAPPLAEIDDNPFQGGFDQVAMAAPVSKWARRVSAPHTLAATVTEGLRRAVSGRPGPVFLEIPMDLMFGQIEAAPGIDHASTPLCPVAAPLAADIEAAIALLRAAERPAVLAGGGVWYADAGAELVAFCEATGIPAFTNARSHGVIPGDHPLCGGWVTNLAMLGGGGGPGPDAVLVAGARLGVFAGGRSARVIPRRAAFVHLHVDATELGRLRRPDVAILADCKEGLAALTATATATGGHWPDFSAWQARVRAIADTNQRDFAEVISGTEGPIHPARAIRTVLDGLDNSAIIVADGAECFHWLEMMLRAPCPGSFLAPGYLGCLGVGLPMAVGAKVAHPDLPVVCVTGDGAVGLNIAEFDTMVRHDLGVVTVIINNQSWGASVHGQEVFYGRNRLAVSQLGDVAYHEVAAGFGCFAEVVECPGDLAPALARALDCGRPACLNVMVDAHAVPPDVAALIAAMNDQWYGDRSS